MRTSHAWMMAIVVISVAPHQFACGPEFCHDLDPECYCRQWAFSAATRKERPVPLFPRAPLDLAVWGLLRMRGGRIKVDSSDSIPDSDSEKKSKGKTRSSKKAAKKSLKMHFVSGGSRGGDEEHTSRPRTTEGKQEPVDGDTVSKKQSRKQKTRKSVPGKLVRVSRRVAQAVDDPVGASSFAKEDADTARRNETSTADGAFAGVSSEDEYIDWFKYHWKWAPDREDLGPPLVPHSLMPPELREISRLVCPLAGSRPFHEKLAADWVAGVEDDGETPILRRDLPRGFLMNETLLPHLNLPSADALWKMTPEELAGVDDASAPTVRRAIQRKQRNATAGPDWFDLPSAPKMSARPDLRAALKLLSRRKDWDPKNRFKSIGWERKGGSTKSPLKVSYPKYFHEGVVALDPVDPRENLPSAMRKMSLAEQILQDPAIKHHLQRRFKKKMTIAGGWHAKKGEKLEWDVQKKEKKIRLRAPREVSLAHRDAKRELRKAQAYMKDALDIGHDPLAARVLPKMPSQPAGLHAEDGVTSRVSGVQGGQGKTPEQMRKEREAGAEERIKRARKKREEKEKRRRARGVKKRRVDKTKSRVVGKLKRLRE